MGRGDVCLLTEARGSLDQGEECLSSIKLTEPTNGVALDFSRRGEPTDNAAIESSNGRFREERLNVLANLQSIRLIRIR